MMKNEFEELAGYEVTNDDYNNIIEPMYMATKMTKQEFVRCIDKKRFALPTKAQMRTEMKKIAHHLFEICGRYTDFESEKELDRLVRKYAARFHGIDWEHDTTTWVIIDKGYEFGVIGRGCTYPKTIVIGKGNYEYERIELVKEAM